MISKQIVTELPIVHGAVRLTLLRSASPEMLLEKLV